MKESYRESHRARVGDLGVGSALALAETARMDTSAVLEATTRSELGQFMTPARVAAFMASMFGPLPEDVHLLDAGAGLGALTAAFVQEACSREPKPRSITVTAFEVDGSLAGLLRLTLDACAQQCQAMGIAFSSRLVHDDYILQSSQPLIVSDRERAVPINCAILNPPYLKIAASSAWRRALRTMGIETTNLYSAFVAVALAEMDRGGQMVAITPRSFCNGTYFEPFRKTLIASSALEQIHVYESRRKAFAEDAVLQENVIFHLTKGVSQEQYVRISTSDGSAGGEVAARDVPFSEVVVPTDPHQFIRLNVTTETSTLADRVRSLPCTLRDLGISVSTGRVVDFRAKWLLRDDPEPGTAPLIYPTHFEDGYVAWPKLGGKKANALLITDDSVPLLLPNETFVLTKRFTSKEEPRRLVAVVHDPDRVDAEVVGFENHLNYFHEHGRGLPPALARGLAAFLNSAPVDNYFRTFSGHTQVNAGDLKNLHYPSRPQLESLGDAGPMASEQVDRLVVALLQGNDST